MKEFVKGLSKKVKKKYKYIDTLDYVGGDSSGEQYEMTTKTGTLELWELRENKKLNVFTIWQHNEDTGEWDYIGTV